MTGRGRALMRLFAVQGAWNYERMLGVGMGYAAAPLLRDLARSAPERYPGALERAAEFFNSHPYLAPLALGASVRAEYDGVPGAQISRLRTALCSPLGALGDQLFWAGLLPALLGAALAAVALGARWCPVPVFLVVFNTVRVAVATWGLRTGLASGMKVGGAIQASRLPRLVPAAGLAAGVGVGVAIPLVGGWLLRPLGGVATAAAVAIAVVGLGAARLLGARYSAPRYGLLVMAVALLLHGVLR